MKSQKFTLIIFGLLFILLAGCSFLGSIFKTGVGVGAFLVIALIVIIFLLIRIGRRNTM